MARTSPFDLGADVASECYELVRGSSLRITDLDKTGRLPEGPVRYGVSKSVASVNISEVTDEGANEMLRTDVAQGEERRLHLVRSAQTIRYTADINFLRLDPGLLSLLVEVPLVYNASGDIVGFDRNTKVAAKSFALEVWTRLVGAACADGTRRWGYTVFPFLKGGTLSGFSFANGLVSFNLRGAATQRGGFWGTGPYLLDMPDEVSRNTGWRQTLVSTPPPEQANGIAEFSTDFIDGGTATMTSDDVVDGQFAVTSNDVVDGGAA